MDWGLEAHHLPNDKLGGINFYISSTGINQDKPVMFLYSGCSGLPTMLVVTKEDKSMQFGTIPPDEIRSFSINYHVVLIGRPGTPFCDTMEVDEINPYKNLEEYQPSEDYIARCGMEWEVEAISLVLDTLGKMVQNSGNTFVATGLSEGGRIMARLAAGEKRITHLVCLVSGGLNQFYSDIINRRMDAFAGKISHEEAQEKIDELFQTYRDIYADAQSTERWYYGHPYKRWGSYCNDIPLEHLLELDIPICMVNASLDRSSPILQSDYVMLEFIRHGKTNLDYFSLPGMNHQFFEIVRDDSGEEHGVNKRSEVFDMVDDWIQAKL